jgi:hypothetical protein
MAASFLGSGEAALLTSACPPAIAYSRVGTGWIPSAVPSSSNFPASHLGSELGLIAQSYRAFSSPHSADLRGLRRHMFRQSSAAVATSREDHRSLRSGRGSPAPMTGPGIVSISMRATSIEPW